MFLKKLITCSTFGLLSVTASMASAATVNYEYGQLLVGGYTPTEVFASLSVTSSSDNKTFSFVLNTFNLDSIFSNANVFIGSEAGDANYNVTGSNLPTATIFGSGNGVTIVTAGAANGPTGLYDFRYNFGSGNKDRLTQNETVSWTSVFASAQTFDGALFALHVQGLDSTDTTDGKTSAWYTPNISAVPVPAALPLMASALGIFGLARRRNKSKAA